MGREQRDMKAVSAINEVVAEVGMRLVSTPIWSGEHHEIQTFKPDAKRDVSLSEHQLQELCDGKQAGIALP